MSQYNLRVAFVALIVCGAYVAFIAADSPKSIAMAYAVFWAGVTMAVVDGHLRSQAKRIKGLEPEVRRLISGGPSA